MTTTTNTTGGSIPNPNPGAAAPRARTRTPAANAPPVATAGSAAAPAGGDVLLAQEAAVHSASDLLVQLKAVLAPYMQTLTASNTVHTGRVSAGHEALIPQTANLLRNEPALATATTADELDRGVAMVGALRQLGTGLQGVLTDVQHTARGVNLATWVKTRMTITLGQHMAKADGHLATVIAPLTQATKRGPRVASTELAVTTSQQKLTRSQQKLARSEHQTALAQQRADAARLAQSIAAAQRTGGPAPATPAPSAGTGTPHTG